MRVKREELVHCLEAVHPGVGTSELVEQSDCYVFQNGWITTFNEEVACRIRSPVDLQCAVPANELRALVDKLKDETLDISVQEDQLLIKGRGRAGLSIETAIKLPLEAIPTPKEWKTLPLDFSDAVDFVKGCTTKRRNAHYVHSCLHLTSTGIEATDDIQACCYALELPISEDFLVRYESIKNIAGLGMHELSETGTWVHFRNADGLIYSAKRNTMRFPAIQEILKPSGTHVQFAAGMRESLQLAGIFSKTAIEDDVIYLHIKSGGMLLEGRGVHGWYKEPFKIPYAGESFSFAIGRDVLEKVLERTNECQLSQDRLFIEHGQFQYVTCLLAT